MPDVLMIGVVLWAGLIMVAAGLTVMQWRRSRGEPSMPVRDRRAVVAGLADAGTVKRLPERHREIVRPGGRSDVPAGPGPAAQSQVSGVADAEPGSDRQGAEPDQRQAGAEELTASERIARFYQEADRPVAAFLTAVGWTQEHRTPAWTRGPRSLPPPAGRQGDRGPGAGYIALTSRQPGAKDAGR